MKRLASRLTHWRKLPAKAYRDQRRHRPYWHRCPQRGSHICIRAEHGELIAQRSARATSAQVVYGRLAAPSCDRYAARFDFVSLGSGAGSETGAGLSRPSTVR